MDDTTIVVTSLTGFTVEADYHAYDLTISDGTAYVFNYMSYLHDIVQNSYVITYNTPDTVHVVMDSSNLPQVIEQADYQHKITNVTATVGGPELYQEAIHQSNEGLVSMYFYSRTSPQSGRVDLSDSTVVGVDIVRSAGVTVDPDDGVKMYTDKNVEVYIGAINTALTEGEQIPVKLVGVKEGLDVSTSLSTVDPSVQLPVKPADGASFPVNQLLDGQNFKTNSAVTNFVSVQPVPNQTFTVTPDTDSVWSVNPISTAVWVVKQLSGLLGTFRVTPADSTPFPTTFSAGATINANMQAQAAGTTTWQPVRGRAFGSQVVLSSNLQMVNGNTVDTNGGKLSVIAHGTDGDNIAQAFPFIYDAQNNCAPTFVPAHYMTGGDTFGYPAADPNPSIPYGCTPLVHLAASEVRINNEITDAVPVGIVP